MNPENDENVSLEATMPNRRTFLKNSAQLIGLGFCGVSALSIITSCENFTQKDTTSGISVTVIIDNEDDITRTYLNRIGYGVAKSFGHLNYGIPLIILRIEEEKFACFSAMCTHDHCVMKNPAELPAGVKPGYRLIRCSCHGSKYDPYNSGSVVEGPAEQALKQFPVTYDKANNAITIEF